MLKKSSEKIQESDLLDFQNKFNIKLPESYKEFMLKNNGGYPSANIYQKEDIETRVNMFYSIKYGELTVEEAIDDFQILEDTLPKDLLPFAIDEGGNCFCVGIKEHNFDKIYIWYFDTDKNQKIYIEPSFKDFIENLGSKE